MFFCQIEKTIKITVFKIQDDCRWL